MSIYTCKGDTPEDLEKAERFKKIFLKIAFERAVIVQPLKINELEDYHFSYENNDYDVANLGVTPNNKRYAANFYGIYQAALFEINKGNHDYYGGMFTTTTILNY
jgi:hypothetical protein